MEGERVVVLVPRLWVSFIKNPLSGRENKKSEPMEENKFTLFTFAFEVLVFQ